MRVLAFFSYSARSVSIPAGQVKQPIDQPEVSECINPAILAHQASEPDAKDVPTPSLPTSSSIALNMLPAEPQGGPSIDLISERLAPEAKVRRLAFRGFFFARPTLEEHKSALSAVHDHEKKAHASAAFSKRLLDARSSNADKRAKESALIVRSLIVGPSVAASPQITKANAKPQLNKIKSQLIQAKSANRVIAQLRALPISDEPAGDKDKQKGTHVYRMGDPIHAVCLEHTDEEENKLHFAPLTQDYEQQELSAQLLTMPGVSSASMDELATLFNKMNVIDLVKSPDLGLGQPGDGEGILAGAVPTAETVIKGIEQITPQLMALGYATGRAVLPDHTGIYPPTDRMSVLTYWWGLELVLPPPSLQYLANAQSIAGTIVNFLSALSLVNNGVREILPFVRYIAQFIDFEFDSIKRQNKGRGVVCAATWIMPAAMVPRPWDFPVPPNTTIQPVKGGDRFEPNPPVPSPPIDPTSPAEDTLPPFTMPLPPPSLPDVVTQLSAEAITLPTNPVSPIN